MKWAAIKVWALSIFLDQTEARRAEKVFFETDPPTLFLSEGLDPPLDFITLFF